MNQIKGKVVHVVSPSEVVINLGSNDGVTEAARFLVFAVGEEMKDPDTGEALGQLEIVRGKAEVKHVQESMTTLRSAARKKVIRNRFEPVFEPFMPSLKMEMKRVPEEVEDIAPFEDVKVGDLVRSL